MAFCVLANGGLVASQCPPSCPTATGLRQSSRWVLLDCPVAADIRRGRRQVGVVLAALAALAFAWVVVTPKSVPLYDGIGAPDEAYRYVQPPSGTKPTKPPLPATADSDAGQGTNPHPFYVSSD